MDNHNNTSVHQNNNVGFSFPMLKNSEILECMKEMDVELTKDELLDPHKHKERLRSVFMQLLSSCTGKSEDDLQANAAMKAAAARLPNGGGSLHVDHFGDVQFYLSLQTLMLNIGVPNFSLRDLHYPTAKRLRVQLSAIINFVKFLQEQLKVYAELSEPRQVLLEDLVRVQHEEEQLVAQLEETELQSKDQLHAMDEVAEECHELELEIARNNKLQSAAREAAAAMKSKLNDLKDEMATAVWAFQEAEAEAERLRAQVVSSPDRRRGDLEQYKERLDNEKQQCSELEKKIQTTNANITSLKEASENLKSTLADLNDVQNEASKHASFVQNKQETQRELEALEKTTRELSSTCEEVERDVYRSEEELNHQSKSHKLQMDAAQDSLTVAKNQLLEVEKDRRDGMARVHTGEATVRELEETLAQEQMQHEAEIKALIADYRETEAAFLQRNEKRMSLLVGAGEA